MKNKVLKFGLIVVCLLSNALIFAQAPGDNSDTGDLSGGDARPAPIGDYIWVIALLVVIYAFWKLRAVRNTKLQD